MKGMKKKGREREGKGARKDTINKSLSVVMAVVLVSSVMTAFAPFAAADISIFTINPDEGIVCEVSEYEVILNTTAEFTTLNVVLPAGFGVEEPSGGELIARVDLWNDTQYYGFVTFMANGSEPSNKLDVHAEIGDIADVTIDVDYTQGGTTNVGSPYGGASHANLTLPNLTLPTTNDDGYLNVSLPMGMRDVTIDIEEFVKNPTACGDYKFDVTVNGYSDSDTVRITEIEAINVISPESKAYASLCVRLNFTIEPEGGTFAWIGYSLDGGTNVTILGNTTVPVGAPPYDHNIVVYASDTCGNTVASNTVSFKIHPADIDGDCKVYVRDLLLLARAYASRPGDANWNPDADLDCDNRIYLRDWLILAQNYGNTYPCNH